MSYGAAGFAEYGLPTGASVATAVGRGGGKAKARALLAPTEEMAWEKTYERTWDAIEEDEETGALITRRLGRARGTAGADNSTAHIQRGMMRHVFLVLDMSRSMESNDLKPSRAAATVELAGEFVREYFDQNPISSLGVIVAADGLAIKVSDLSGNPRRHTDAITAQCKTTSGDLSLQNCLETASRTLMLAPPFGTREVVLVQGAHATCDPGNIDDAIAECVAAKVRVAIISLPGEVYVSSRIAKDTGGTYVVPENYDAFRTALLACCRPPPRRADEEVPLNVLVQMGFPKLVSEKPGLCSCHLQLRPHGYICPRCSARSCEVPTVCPVCSLQLVSAPGLARTYHHLFPVPLFIEVPRAGGAGMLIVKRKQPPSVGSSASFSAAAAAAVSSSPSSSSSSSSSERVNGRSNQVEVGALLDQDGEVSSASAPPLLSSDPMLSGGERRRGSSISGREQQEQQLRGSTAAPEDGIEMVGDESAFCSACTMPLARADARYVCPRCRFAYCRDCDTVIHETLHNCPSCVGNRTSLQ